MWLKWLWTSELEQTNWSCELGIWNQSEEPRSYSIVLLLAYVVDAGIVTPSSIIVDYWSIDADGCSAGGAELFSPRSAQRHKLDSIKPATKGEFDRFFSRS